MDFYLAYSPERENPGDKDYATQNIPKVVGGVTPQCRKMAKTFYDQIVVKTVVTGTQLNVCNDVEYASGSITGAVNGQFTYTGAENIRANYDVQLSCNVVNTSAQVQIVYNGAGIGHAQQITFDRADKIISVAVAANQAVVATDTIHLEITTDEDCNVTTHPDTLCGSWAV